jgi:hypothetical protein
MRVKSPLIATYIAVFFTILIFGLSIFSKSAKSACDLSGKEIVYDFTSCPQGNIRQYNRCIRTRQRIVIVGDKILHFHSEVERKGTVYHIGNKLEVTNKLGYKSLVGKPVQRAYKRVWITADRSSGYLRFNNTTKYYRARDDLMFLSQSESFIFDLKGCNSCELENYVSTMKNHATLQQDSLVLTNQECDIRSAR